MAILTQITAINISRKMFQDIGFQGKGQLFHRKLAKIAQTRDRNIGP
jgi:hypothetical protein